MKVRYNKALAIINILLGVILACLYLILAIVGKRETSPLILGVLGILFGILLVSRPYFVLADDMIILYALLGPAKTVYPFKSLKDIEIQGKKVLISQEDASPRAVPLARWMADKKDWQAFLEKVNAAKK